MKHLYRIAPRPISASGREDPALLQSNVAQDCSEEQGNDIIMLTKAQIDAELEMMKSMTAEEAAAVAARAVAEAQAAIAAAEAAALEAEEAEAEAEAAHCFADAARKALASVSIRGTNFNTNFNFRF